MASFIDYNGFNIRDFINEVHKRPPLWDSSHDDYRNRILRQNAWLDICDILLPHFKEKDKDEKMMVGRELQQKWKYIRDAYIRQMRLAARKTSGSCTRTYIYAKYLTFLKLDPPHTKAANWNIPMSEEDETHARTLRRRKFLRTTRTGVIRAKRYKSPAEPKNTLKQKYEETETEMVTPTKTSIMDESIECNVNDDVAFFRSLLPTLSELEPSQKLLFRIDVMKILHSYATQSNIYNSDSGVGSNTSSPLEEVPIAKVSPNDNFSE